MAFFDSIEPARHDEIKSNNNFALSYCMEKNKMGAPAAPTRRKKTECSLGMQDTQNRNGTIAIGHIGV